MKATLTVQNKGRYTTTVNCTFPATDVLTRWVKSQMGQDYSIEPAPELIDSLRGTAFPGAAHIYRGRGSKKVLVETIKLRLVIE